MYETTKAIRTLLLLLVLGLCAVSKGYAQGKFARVSVAFYNLENLFDTEDGENNDADFLPNGANQWTQERYLQKVENMATAISRISAGKAPDILGVCEIENRRVLEDLITHPKLAPYEYNIVHFDSPDLRGIDCALLYRPKVFKLQGAQPHPVIIPGEEYIKTRDVLQVDGTIMGEDFSLLVGHWPSRSGGEQISLNRRMAAAKVMRRVVDSVQSERAQTKFILMGDFNDDPTSPSMTEGLGSVNYEKDLTDGGLLNIMARLHRSGRGTLAYQDVWNLFDNLVVSSNLIGQMDKSWHVLRDEKTKAYGRIFSEEFLTQKTGQFKGYPFRTFSYGNFQNGYSDHYPVFLYLVRSL